MTPDSNPHNLCFWHDFWLAWPNLSRSVRHQTLRSAGRTLHDIWRGRYELDDLAFELTTWQQTGGRWVWNINPVGLKQRRAPCSIDAVCGLLKRWYEEMAHRVSAVEAYCFLSGFLDREQLEPDTRRQLALEIAGDQEVQQAIDPARLYKQSLAVAPRAIDSFYNGHWALDYHCTPAMLAQEIAERERLLDVKSIKQTQRVMVFHAKMFGQDVLIKRYNHPRLSTRLRYVLRRSPARRAWAAGDTMNRLDLQTPAPFGFLEVGHHGLPTRSYFICAYEADAYDGRQWVRTRYRHADDATRQRYRDQLRHTLLSLYAVGGYHRDTKLSNFMVREDGSHGDPLWMWIDLESVTFDCAIKPRHVIRNLVQLNSSIRNAWLTEADRLLFLREMAQHVPELLQPRVIKQMREWTLKRWR